MECLGEVETSGTESRRQSESTNSQGWQWDFNQADNDSGTTVGGKVVVCHHEVGLSFSSRISMSSTSLA